MIKEIDNDNVSRIRKGSVIKQGAKEGKVLTISKRETFGFILYEFQLVNGEILKHVKSTL